MEFRDRTEKRAVNKMIRLAHDSNLQKEHMIFDIYIYVYIYNIVEIIFLYEIIYLLNSQEAETISG